MAPSDQKVIPGVWWPEGRHDDRAAGVLTISADGTCTLELVGGFALDVFSPRTMGGDKSHRLVMHGAGDGQEVTLFDCHAAPAPYGSAGRTPAAQRVAAVQALVGLHVRDRDDTVLTSVRLNIEHLTAWLGFDYAVIGHEDDTGSALSVTRPEEVVAAGDGWRCSAGLVVQDVDRERTRAREHVGFEAEGYLRFDPDHPISLHDALDVIMTATDLLTLATGAPAGLISARVVHAVPVTRTERDGSTFSVWREAVVHGRRIHQASPNSAGLTELDFLFDCRAMAFAEVWPRWWELRQKAKEACNVYFSLRYARPTFTEVRVLLQAIVAESLHDKLYGEPLPEVVLRNARRRADAKVEGPVFYERCDDLAQRMPQDVVNVMTRDVAAWAQRLKVARNRLAHTGNDETLKLFDLERLTDGVIALTLMRELGLPVETQTQAAELLMWRMNNGTPIAI